MANPDPEINPNEAKEIRPDAILQQEDLIFLLSE